MSLSIATPIKNALLDSYGVNFNGGTLKIYSGAVPADANASLGAAVVLGTLAFGATAFQAASGGSMSANAITQDSSADASGEATFYRAFKSDGVTPIEQGSITATGNGGDLQLNTTTIVQGGPILVTDLTRGM